MSKNPIIAHRTFLEPAKNSVNSYVSLSVYEHRSHGSRTLVVSLTIADCDRSVSLSFDIDGFASKADRLKKLAKLEKALALLRQTIEGYDPNLPDED